MLQSKQVSQVLSQVLDETDKGPILASLLSEQGLPLTTVMSPTGVDIGADNLRIYSLLTINSFHQQQKSGDPNLDNWALVELDGNVRAMVKQFSTLENDTENYHNDMFVVLFYTAEYPDAQAKVKLDLVTAVLADGLRGYMSH